MLLEGKWLEQGFFRFDSSTNRITPTEEIKKLLADGLRIEESKLHRKSYPVGPAFRHTIWWREGHYDYAEVQFVAQISKHHPILTLGISIEKGYEDSQIACRKSERMDRKGWDWPNLVINCPIIVDNMLPTCAETVRRPISFRISGREHNGNGRSETIYNLIDRIWFQRHVGKATSADIPEEIRLLDKNKNWWVNVYIGCDFYPFETDKMDTDYTAQILLAFSPIRRLLRKR